MLICQGCFVVGGEAWIALKRIRHAEAHAFEERGVLLACRLVDLKFGVHSFKFHADLSVLICIVQCAVSDLYTGLDISDFRRDERLDDNLSFKQVRTDAEEMLIPYTKVLGVAPCLDECTRTLHP